MDQRYTVATIMRSDLSSHIGLAAPHLNDMSLLRHSGEVPPPDLAIRTGRTSA